MRRVSAALVCLLGARLAHADDEPLAPYKVEIVLGDAIALSAIPGGVAGLYYAANQRFDPAVVFATLPVCLLAPTIHLMHRRPVAALVSFLGWTATAALTWTIVFGTRFRACSSTDGCEDIYAMSAGIGIPSALIGGAAMTLTDAALAHDTRKSTGLQVTPNGFVGMF